jgi:acyl-CoA thioester hydrolase
MKRVEGKKMADQDSVAPSTSPGSPPIECGLAVVHPWLCDVMGHLTTRHYMAMFDDASYQFLSIIGYDARAASEQRWGWADVRHEINYISELAAGAVVRIEGWAKARGRSSITLEFQLMDRSDGRVCATLEAKIVCFDLEARRSRPLPPHIADTLAVMLNNGAKAT